jgi:alpha-beta hydrolase superfamily lysophospholipase
MQPVHAVETTVFLPSSWSKLEGDLHLPEGAQGLVIFAHGSGSSRKSPRNRFVADALHARGLGTLLFDLLTVAEERQDARDGHLRFDIPFLARRLIDATDEVREHSEVMNLPIGYFGASTGAAAALMAAAQRPHVIGAVVSRGGRPDLAGPALENVHAPTLLVVGGEDLAVLDLNEDAMRHLNCERRLSIVRGATHLFEEPGALEEVAQLAGAWFLEHLGVEDELWAPS